MDLLINVSLIVFASIGAICALGGRTWDETQTSILKKLTDVGKVSLACIIMTIMLGVWKDLRIREDNFELRLENAKMNERVSNTQKLLLDQERIQEITFYVDAFDQKERSGFNTLKELKSKFQTDLISENQAVGIHCNIRYGDLILSLVGHSSGDTEEWFLNLSFSNANRQQGEAIGPQPLDNAGTFLIQGTLGDEEFEKFLKYRPKIASIVRRSNYGEHLFDPNHELGVVEIVAFGGLKEGVLPTEFARQPANYWSGPKIEIPREAMIAWNIGLSINDRLIYGLESVPDGNPVNPVTKRFVSWDIDEKYWPRQHKILISPLPDHWEEYYPIMNDNVRQLLYDDRG